MGIKQIVLVTDGESNMGVNPIQVAKEALNQGIKVNTIGIVTNTRKESPLLELQNIASNGGGVSEITDLEKLSQALSMVTVKSVYKTIEEVVSKELKQIVDKDIKEIPPSSRRKIVDIIDKLGDEISIECCILLDSSGSMRNKIGIAKKSILELLRFMKQRKGETRIAVVVYPSESDCFYKVLCKFTKDIDELEKKLDYISTGGTTPTGPALKGCIELMTKQYSENEPLSDYIV